MTFIYFTILIFELIIFIYFRTKAGDLQEEAGRNSNSNKDDAANDNRDECETCGDSESACSGDHLPPLRNFHNYKQGSLSSFTYFYNWWSIYLQNNENLL